MSHTFEIAFDSLAADFNINFAKLETAHLMRNNFRIADNILNDEQIPKSQICLKLIIHWKNK